MMNRQVHLNQAGLLRFGLANHLFDLDLVEKHVHV